MSNFYTKYKNILSGSKTREDAFYILDYLTPTLTKDQRDIIYSYICGKHYDMILSNQKMVEVLQEISTYKFRDDAKNYADGILKKTTDPVQINSINRLINTKPYKTITVYPTSVEDDSDIQENKYKSDNNIIKQCPYCNHKYVCYAEDDASYIMCGYMGSEYDWEGCGNDWCFRCGKKLCKNWEENQLFVPEHRIHDGKCCKKHASLYGNKYPEDYCMCETEHVNRNRILS